jgi:MerR family transcriptional regulator/heat shock protein HspR
MAAHYLKRSEVLERLSVTPDLLDLLESAELIHPKRTLEEEVLISVEDVDRIRVTRILTEEMEVNLAGAEVILHMRDEIFAMQRQFDEILRTLVAELRQRLRGG